MRKTIKLRKSAISLEADPVVNEVADSATEDMSLQDFLIRLSEVEKRIYKDSRKKPQRGGKLINDKYQSIQ
jgi:hypothetical protein